MKFSVAKSDFADKLALVSRAVSTRAAIQALAGVRLRAHENRVELAATDMEIGLLVDVFAEVTESGEVVVPGRLLHDVVKQLPAGQLEVEYKAQEREFAIEAGSGNFTIKTLSGEDFPELATANGERIEVPAPEFVETIGKVARAASRDETRPHLTGILVTAEGSELRMVATDSYRLSVKRTKLQKPLIGSFEANIPARTLQELARIATGNGMIRIAARERQIVFEVDGVRLTSRLVEGQFPNYQQLLPDSFEHELKVNAAEIAQSVHRVSLLAQRNTPLRMRFGEGELVISSQTPDVGEAREVIPLAGFSGETIEIGFNADFLREGLESAASETVTLKLISPFRPGLIESGDDGEFLYLVMPIRLNA